MTVAIADMTINVLLLDDHAVVRDGVSYLLNAQPDVSVVAGAQTAWQAVQLAEREQPHVAIVDISLPGLSGIEAIPQILEASPATKILVLSMHSSLEYIYQAFQAGAHGYVLKESAGSEVVAAVRSVHAGKHFLSRRLAGSAVEQYLKERHTASPLESLSSRERQVLQLIVDGKTSGEVAALLALSPKSVDTYRSRIMRKLGIGDLPGLVKFAIRHGLTSY
jgi:two-component system, NarL family, response regulator NreC